ncbi:MAG: ABC transporter substrate-binding protein, partial [Gemmatimonadaceae bacterium]
MSRRGIDLAVAEVNAGGGIRGHRLEIIAHDDSGDGARAAAIAQQFVDNEPVLAVIGHLTSRAMIAAARIYDGKLVAVTPTASSPDLAGISRWTFRVVSNDSVAGITLGKFATSLGYERAAILYENNTYGRGLAESFQRNFGGRVVSMDPVAEEAQDFEPFVAYFRQQAPDVVFVVGQEGPGLALLREARRQRLETAFLGGDSWERVAGDTIASEGAYVGVPFSPDDPHPAAQRFVAAFREKYGMLPDANAA